MSGELSDPKDDGLPGIFPASLNSSCFLNITNCSHCDFHMSDFDKSDFTGDFPAVVRFTMAVIYSLVCALGLVGNVLVLYLMKSKQVWRKSSINLFVTCLAVTDFQFVLTLPFWAVETALDFTWIFGKAMCKIVAYVTAMNMYASVFFLTAMSLARYWSVASALKGRRRRRAHCCSARLISTFIWVAAASAALPNAVFLTTVAYQGEELCLVKFPEPNRFAQLGLYQSQKVLLGFVVPLGIISVSYLLLLRFITSSNVNTSSARRRAKVTRSVTIVVLSFFLCWLPNQALTVWSILIKVDVLPFSQEYYTVHAYVFPVSVCLAHCNSCLNPILYCLTRREFRKALKNLLWRLASPTLTTLRPITASTKPEVDEQGQMLMPSNAPAAPAVLFFPPGTVVYDDRRDLPQNST